tara:strand:- start:414 stop:779 length:366 start_codon:yes stop_codon:yes gene_type:complete
MILLSGGDKYYQNSGVVIGDVTSPATISLITIPNTGLRDSFVIIQYSCGNIISSGGDQLGISVKLDDVEIINAQGDLREREINPETWNLFVPRQSKLEIISLNTSGNNTQKRSVNLLGYYL